MIGIEIAKLLGITEPYPVIPESLPKTIPIVDPIKVTSTRILVSHIYFLDHHSKNITSVLYETNHSGQRQTQASSNSTYVNLPHNLVVLCCIQT